MIEQVDFITAARDTAIETGVVVINTFVKPTKTIPPIATKIHGITDQMLVNAPGWKSVGPWLAHATNGKTLVIYNAEYDLRVINQTSHFHGVPNDLAYQAFHCAMQYYAEFCGDWNDYRGGFRWQKLEGGDHSAIGDCRATLDVIRRMAGSKLSSEQGEVLDERR